MAATRELAIIRQALGEAHRDAGTDRGRRADEEGLPGVMRREGGGEERRQCGHRTIHQPDEAGLYDLQQEQPALGLALLDLGIRREVGEAQLHRDRFVALFGFGEIEQQLLDLRVAAALGRLLVEAVVLEFDHLGALAHFLDVHLADGPGRLVAHEALDVGAADQRNEVAELLGIEVGEPAAVLVFLFRHFHENLGGGGIGVHQRMGKPCIGAGIIVLARDCEGKEFLFGEFGEALHGDEVPWALD